MLKVVKKISVSAVAVGFALWSLPVAADCSRGDLDKRFCDIDGDLVADTPTDVSKQIDPDTLIFAYTPVEDPAVYKTAWADFLDHLEKETNKKVVFFPVQSMLPKLRLCVQVAYTLLGSTQDQTLWL